MDEGKMPQRGPERRIGESLTTQGVPPDPDRPGDIEQGTGSAGADSERESIEGTTEPGADTTAPAAGAGSAPKAGAR
jgi:hypothetical protein